MSEKQVNSNYKWVMLVVALAIQMNGAFAIQAIGPCGSFIREDLNMSYTQFGLIFTAINFGTMLLMTWAGAMTDRSNIRKVLLVGGCGVGISMIVCSMLAHAPWQLLLFLFIAGLFNSVGSPCSSKPIAGWFTGKGKATAMGFKQCAIPFAGLICGAVFPAVSAALGWHKMFLLDGIWCCLLSIICFVLYRDPPDLAKAQAMKQAKEKAKAEHTAPTLKDILTKDQVCLGIGCLFLNGVQYAFSNYLVSYMTEMFTAMAAASAAVLAGSYYSMTNFGGIVGRLGVGAVSDHLLGGRRKEILVAINVVAVVIVVVFALAGNGLAVPVIGVLAVLFGLTGLSFTGLQVSFAIELAGGWKAAGTASGFTMTMCFAGMMLAPPFFGAILDSMGWTAAWIALAAVGVIGIAFLLPIKERRE